MMPTRLVLVLALAAALTACGGSPAWAPKSEAASTFPAPGPVPRTRTADDVANFLAGIPGRPGSPLAGLESEPAWQTFRGEMDSSWNRIAYEWLPPMSAFQKTELAGLPGASQVVFYPFSGPDALAITILFPSSPVYVMVGLEPGGTLPEPNQFSPEKLESHLAAVRDSVSSVFQRSFFISYHAQYFSYPPVQPALQAFRVFFFVVSDVGKLKECHEPSLGCYLLYILDFPNHLVQKLCFSHKELICPVDVPFGCFSPSCPVSHLN